MTHVQTHFAAILLLIAALVAPQTQAKDEDMDKILTVSRNTALVRVEKATTELNRLDEELRKISDKKSVKYQDLASRREKVLLYAQYHDAYADYVQARFELNKLTATTARQLRNDQFATPEQTQKLQELDARIQTKLAAMREASKQYATMNGGEGLTYPHTQYLVQSERARLGVKD